MQTEQNNAPSNFGKQMPSGVNIGNASNPAPDDDSFSPSPGNQLLDEKAEKYLREVASPEDYPDAQDEQEMNETLKEGEE